MVPFLGVCGFWEYVANVAYAVVLFRIRHKLLWLLTGTAAIVLCYSVYHYGNLSVGWAGSNFWGGGARIFYSFLAGMLAYRSGWIIQSGLGFRTMAVLLSIAFLVPFSDDTNLIVEPIIVILYFPFLVALGAGAQLMRSDQKFCVLSGQISYPLYMVHYPFMWLFMSYIEKHQPGREQMTMIMCVGLFFLVGLAYWVMVYLDIPIRKALKSQMKKKVVKEKVAG